MAITSINRGLVTRTVTASATAQLEDDQIFCNATSGAITITLYEPVGDGAKHQLEVIKTDSSANAITITDGTLSTSLIAQDDSVLLEQQYSGAWFVVSDHSTSSAGSAASAATSAGLAASVASSAGASLVLTDSATRSVAASATLSGTSASQSIAASATLSGTSASQSIAASATLSGTSASQSIAASAVLSGVSGTASVAESQNLSQSANVSSAMSLASS